MTVTDLLPCPFCGGDAVTENLILEGVVRCSGCCAKIIRKHEVKEDTGQAEAIAAWNTRAPLAEALAVPEVAALVYAAKMVMHDLHHGNGLEGLYANRDRLDAALRAIGGDA